MRFQCENCPWPGDKLDDRPIYILASFAQALDKVHDLIEEVGGGDINADTMPTPEQWALLKELAFPPPPMA